jgi:hypothetical protein
MAKRRRAPRHPRASVAEMIEDDTLRELEPNEHIRKLMRQGFEEAFRAQIGLLYRTFSRPRIARSNVRARRRACATRSRLTVWRWRRLTSGRDEGGRSCAPSAVQVNPPHPFPPQRCLWRPLPGLLISVPARPARRSPTRSSSQSSTWSASFSTSSPAYQPTAHRWFKFLTAGALIYSGWTILWHTCMRWPLVGIFIIRTIWSFFGGRGYRGW